jgi:hypothetical protein
MALKSAGSKGAARRGRVVARMAMTKMSALRVMEANSSRRREESPRSIATLVEQLSILMPLHDCG